MTIKKFKKETCSLYQTFNGNPNITCYDIDVLKHIRKSLIKRFQITIPDSDDIKELFTQIRNFIIEHTDCRKESCILDFANNSKVKDLKKFFAPIAPKEWNQKKRQFLSTIEIYEACKQIEDLVPTFKFISVTPIDFDKKVGGSCVTPEVCKLSIDDLKKDNKDKFAIVFNTDPHDKPGEHWMCCFGDIKQKCLYHYDSYASHPEPEVYDLFNRLQKQMGNGTKMLYNNVRHQYKHTECGMFCIYFILQMALNGDFLKNIRNIPDDDAINNMRRKFFNF